MATLADIRQAVYDVLDEPASGGMPTQSQPRWTAARLNDYINEGLRVFSEETCLFRRRHAIPVTAYRAYYELPADMIELLSVTYDDEVLHPTTREELDGADWDWRTRSGEPNWYVADDLSPDSIRLYPLPNTAGDTFSFSSEFGVITRVVGDSDTYTMSQEGGEVISMTPSASLEVFESNSDFGVVLAMHNTTNNLQITYVYYPAELSSDGDSPPKPLGTSRALQYYALWKCYAEEGDAQAQIAAGYLAMFEAETRRHASKSRPRGRHLQMGSFPGSRGVYMGERLPSGWPAYRFH